jgi:hypothetical protein
LRLRSVVNKYVAETILLFFIVLCLGCSPSETVNQNLPEVATCANPSPFIIPDDWRAAKMHPESPYHTGLFSEEARQDVLEASLVPNFRFYSGNASFQAETLGKGMVFVDRRGPLMPLDAVDWSTMDHGRYYATQLHGLVGIGAVFSEGIRFDQEIEQRIGDFIKNWAYCSLHNPEINSRAWFEGTVIKRQANLLAALNYMRLGGQIGNLTYEKLIYLIDRNASYLLDTPDVYISGNHGIRQDMLLAATALHLPNHPRAEEMLRTAETRLDEAAVSLFSDEGIWLEHAPGYVNYALGLLRDTKKLNAFSSSFNPRLLLNNYDASLEYVTSSLTPNEFIPWIGASGATRITSRILQDMRDSDGQEVFDRLAALSNGMQSYPNYGHAVVRGRHPDGLYLILTAAQNLPAGKRHADELSFILYNHGRVWITEGGHQTYEPTAMRGYLQSPLAHNNYMLGETFVGENDAPHLAARLVSAKETEVGYVVVAYSERFPSNGSVTRTAHIDKNFTAMILVDELFSETEGPWTGRFQLPGDLDVQVEGNTVQAIDSATGQTMTMIFSSNSRIGFSTCHGQKKPICGWGTVEGEFGPLTTLMWKVPADDTVTITLGWDG